jgi:hypothetical protein
LFARTGGLDHLIVGPITLVEETPAEVDGGVVDDFRLAVRLQLLVTAVRWDETFPPERVSRAKDKKDFNDKKKRP